MLLLGGLLVGGAALYGVAVDADVAPPDLPDVPATADFATVRITGRAAVDGTAFARNGAVSGFSVVVNRNGTDVEVQAHHGVAAAIARAGALPRHGDRVVATGTLRVRPGTTPALVVHRARDLVVEPVPVPLLPLGGLTSGRVGEPVRVRARVASRRFLRSPRGSLLLDLEDGTGEAGLLVPEPVLEAMEGAEGLSRGAEIEVRAVSGWHDGRARLRLMAPGDLVLLRPGPAEGPAASTGDESAGNRPGEEPGEATGPLAAMGGGGLATEMTPESAGGAEAGGAAPAAVTAARLSRTDLGRTVVVEGTIESRRRFRKGVRLGVSDATGTVTVILWDEVLGGMKDAAALDGGARVRVTGRVGEYRGRLQVVPGRPGDVVLLAAARPSGSGGDRARAEGAAYRAARSSAVTDSRMGQRIEVTGEVSALRGLRGGAAVFSLRDDAGTADVYLPGRVGRGAKGLEDGARVRVRGKVDAYRGKPQLRGEEIEVLEAGTAGSPAAEGAGVAGPTREVRLADVSVAMEGRTVLTSGRIASTREVRHGILLVIEDGGARLTVPVWEDVGKGLGPDRLKVGASVKVRGKVKRYKGTLEVVPASAGDVAILP